MKNSKLANTCVSSNFDKISLKVVFLVSQQRSASIKRPIARLAWQVARGRYLRESLRNLGWPLKGRFVRDKKLNRSSRAHGYVQRDRSARCKTRVGRRGEEIFPRWKTVAETTRANALQIARKLHAAICKPANNERSRQFVCESTSRGTCKSGSHFCSKL